MLRCPSQIIKFCLLYSVLCQNNQEKFVIHTVDPEKFSKVCFKSGGTHQKYFKYISRCPIYCSSCLVVETAHVKLNKVSSKFFTLSQANASSRLIAYIAMLHVRSSLLPFLHAELTDTKLRGLDKKADKLNISVKISKINLILAEKLTPYLFYFLKFTRYGRQD